MPLDSVTLSSVGVNEEEMSDYMAALGSGIGIPERHICICGHQLSRHEKWEIGFSCVVSKSWCSCTEPLAVLQPERVKPFRYSSSGYGKKHALTKGIYTLKSQGFGATWLIEINCFRCGTKNGKIYPAPIDRAGRIASESGKKNALLCFSCINEIGGAFYY